MSGVKDVYDPGYPSHFSLDNEWLSTALLVSSPEFGTEGFHASACVPNVENNAPTTPAVEPISSCRVSPLGCLIQSHYVPHL
jgi:hypothetical protein